VGSQSPKLPPEKGAFMPGDREGIMPSEKIRKNPFILPEPLGLPRRRNGGSPLRFGDLRDEGRGSPRKGKEIKEYSIHFHDDQLWEGGENHRKRIILKNYR